jgi:glycosyltransferase involved in cell wall biosynthesis
MLSLRGHEIRVIDYEILWRMNRKGKFYSKRRTFRDVFKIYKGARITVIRPSIIKVPWIDYVSLVFSHKKEINRQVKEFAPDVIIGFDILNAYLAMKAAKKDEIPFIYYWIDVNHRLIPFKPFQPVGEIVERMTLKQADRILTINDKLRDYVIKLGASPERVQVLRAGINLEKFNPAINGEIVKNKYKILKRDMVLFFMGWLYDFAGLKEVALEMAKIKEKEPNIKLLIVGEGDAFDDLQKIREQYHLDEQIILTGKQPYEEIPGFIAAADICLLPAYPTEKIMEDIVPIKMYEYMAMGKPVITTKLPGVMKEFGVDHGVIYVDRSEDALKRAMELIENGRIEEEGIKARRFVEKNSWDNITDEFERVLEEVIKVGGVEQ